jgi:hypothetical protein
VIERFQRELCWKERSLKAIYHAPTTTYGGGFRTPFFELRFRMGFLEPRPLHLTASGAFCSLRIVFKHLDPCWSEVDRVIGAFPQKRKAVLADGLSLGRKRQKRHARHHYCTAAGPQHLCGQGGNDRTPGCRGKGRLSCENHFTKGQPLSFGST